jgi:hypothetical protein
VPLTGFRVTHLEAVRAQQVALAAQAAARAITSYAEPESAQGDVARPGGEPEAGSGTGRPAADTEGAERLRETLLTFLSEKGATRPRPSGDRTEQREVPRRQGRRERGRPLDDERPS